MLKRCIMIFPILTNMGVINEVRNKFDPLASHVKPHVTLVFPFESQIKSDELNRHLKSVLSTRQSFLLTLHAITSSQPGNYLFLNIDKGKKEIIDMHEQLYTGLLESFKPDWLINRNYNPHMTLGKLENEQDLNKAIEWTKGINQVFKAVVDKVSVEIISENEDSIIKIETDLL